MAGIKSLVGLAFAGSVGMTLLILACAIPNSWWPFFVLIFILLAPLPTLIVQRLNESGSQNNYMDAAIFLTAGCVVSAIALPIVLARAPQEIITTSACYLTIAGNIVIFLTLLGFFMVFPQNEGDYIW